MAETLTPTDILKAIKAGAADDLLDEIAAAIKARQTAQIAALRLGDEAYLTGVQKYLEGCRVRMGTMTSPQAVSVTFLESRGKFRTGQSCRVKLTQLRPVA